MTCLECDEIVRALYNDPRTPPLETEACLCLDCYIAAAEQTAEDCETEVENLRQSISENESNHTQEIAKQRAAQVRAALAKAKAVQA